MIYGKPDAGNKGFISEKAIKGQGMTHSYRYVVKIHDQKGALISFLQLGQRDLPVS